MRHRRKPSDGTAEWPFDAPFDLILNLAVGGDWASQKGIDDAAFPQRMQIDYVRVWQCNRKGAADLPRRRPPSRPRLAYQKKL